MPLALLQMGARTCCCRPITYCAPLLLQGDCQLEKALTSLLTCTSALTVTPAHGRRKFADFEVKKIVGEGHKSSVAWAKDRHSGLDVAIKMYHSSKMSLLNCRQASSLCRSCCEHGAGQTPGVASSKGTCQLLAILGSLKVLLPM